MKKIRKVYSEILKKKNEGNTAIAILSLFTIILIGLFGMFILFHQVLVSRAEGVQDDVTLSNLATYKNIDQQALAINNSDLRITDIEGAFETFKQYLQKNMKLDSNMNGLSGSIADGTVTIKEFTIYNVKENDVEIFTYSDNTHIFVRNEVKDKNTDVVKTVNNAIVKNTTVHATIQYNIDLMFGNKKEVTTSVGTDLVKN
ncbi:hypothetical protein [Clostridium felsineum]|uniref:Uncharacterized protein n=1 Tax=Clostridium felsineum TaxID=36839 RepID=A0A1S8LWP5_9CLOT|nr:hypothetical protein [Clostridium felsineum]URZ05898.1 hypothetical protein CLROS_012300 [Clostridium felsineum]URZ10935.1 hypothetical protein CROST_016510 [Clostridium felsineum]